jgi:ribosomal protein L2
VFGARQRAIRALMDAIGLSEIAAGAGPAYRKRKVASLAGRLAHDVSILFGVGRHFGSQPGAKVSMTIMRAPQHGHGQGSTRSVSGATSGSCWGSAAGGATLRSARALAMLAARLVEAKSP